MRRLTKSLLPVLASLLYAGIASGHIISVVETSSGPYEPSDTLIVDVMLDSEVELFYGFVLYVELDPLVLSADLDASVRHPIPGEGDGYFYYYPGGYWVISSSSLSSPMGPVNQSIATLVFHVIQPAGSTWIVPSFDTGAYGSFVGSDGYSPINVTGEVVLKALHIPVPEPTTTTVLGFGLGLLGILHVLRRHRQGT